MSPEDLLRSYQGPFLPPALRQPALAAAAAAMTRQSAPDPWARIWSSPAWRLAWTTCAVLLLAGHLALSLRGSGTPAPTTLRPQGELAAVADLAPLRLDLVPMADLASTPGTTRQESTS